MKVGIFFFSLESGEGRQPIYLPNGQTGYIRVVQAWSEDLSDALAEANGPDDEDLMNSHYIEAHK